MSDTIRIIIAVGIFLLPFVIYPIYYYLYIWRKTPPKFSKNADKAKSAQ